MAPALEMCGPLFTDFVVPIFARPVHDFFQPQRFKIIPVFSGRRSSVFPSGYF